MPGTTTPKPIKAPLRSQLRKVCGRVTLLKDSIQRMKRKVRIVMTPSRIQCQPFLPSLPAVLKSEGNVPAMKPINSQMNWAAIGESVIDERREGHHTNDPSYANGDEEENVFDEILPDVGQEFDERFVDAEDYHQHTAGKARNDGTDTYKHPFDQADGTTKETICLPGRSFRN